MKTKGLIARFLLLPAVALLAFTSCIDKVKTPNIFISSHTLYVVQNETEEGTEYIPYFGFEYAGKEALDRGELMKDGVLLDFDTDKSLQYCQINPQQYKISTADGKSLTDLNGDYTFNPIGVKGHQYSHTYPLTFSESDVINGDVTVTDFGYKNGKIHATFHKVGAEYYGFYVQVYTGNSVNTDYSCRYQRPLNMFLLDPASAAAIPDQAVDFVLDMAYNKMYFGFTKYKITPVAVNVTSDQYYWKLVKKCQNTGTLTSDDTEATFPTPLG